MLNGLFFYMVIGGSVIVLIILVYLLYQFIKTINDSFVDDEFNNNAIQRHSELTDEFFKNRFK